MNLLATFCLLNPNGELRKCYALCEIAVILHVVFAETELLSVPKFGRFATLNGGT